MSWFGDTLLPAVANAIHRHHDAPLRPRTPAHLALLLERNGDVQEALYVRRNVDHEGLATLYVAARGMKSRDAY